ncbi:nucleolar MIF4G domain-containing protein 1 isoform X3 [Equus quagga]|uniref:nucleolar MIF4G domain-containing protein 1 isoform X3 n=1 Tax=Equus quagga TaxID=89248 RepID=UPI001EE2C614|nr:nucleolar MIF4G domain-containing protein 1 isoform X3 [Equus quagga]
MKFKVTVFRAWASLAAMQAPALSPSRQQGAPPHCPAPRAALRPEAPPRRKLGVRTSWKMAASTSTGAAGRGGRRERVARRRHGGGPRRGPGGGGDGALKRLRLAVEEFVQATSEGGPPGDCAAPRAEGRGRPGGRKSRKELRREKRQLRKARRLQRAAGPAQGPGPGDGPAGGASGPRAGEEGGEGGPAPPRRTPRPPARQRAPRAPAEAAPARAQARGPPGGTGSAAAAAARKRALLAANEEEDREIRKLERCLGLKKRRRKGDGSAVPLSFARDGLDYILGALESGNSGGLYESSSEEEEGAGETLPESDVESDPEDEREEDREEDAEEEKEEQDAEAGAPSEESEEEEEEVEEEKRKKAEEAEGRAKEKRGEKRVRFAEDEERRENSSEDVDTTDEQSLCENGGKYIPPHVRRAEETADAQKKEELERLKKHVKGLINRLSEANMASISGQLEELYMAHSRKDMSDTLTAVLVSACAPAATMPSRLVMEHVLLVSILHRTVGIEVRFMLETMLALKNNDMRKIPGYDPEPVEKLRKLQRALVRSAGSGTETQLRVSWDNVLNADQTGRWWIVGSAWSGAPMIDSGQQKIPQKQLAGTVSSKILELARKQRMNTDVRRNIFCTIMTSEDFLDAFEKLLKLGLKDQQEREIVHVLMDCCLQEKTYNPFYAFLASKFCEHERRFQMTFQFSIWDKFRDLENLPTTNFSNLVHLVAHLLKTKSLPLSILKVVEFSELDKPRVHFLRKVLYILLMETEVEDLGLIFARVSDNPKLGMLREGLKLFISHFLLKSTRAHSSAEEASTLRERADLAAKSLQGKASLRM